LKSHTPRLFSGEKSKEPLLSRRSCSLCSSQGSRRNHNGFEAAVRDAGGNSAPCVRALPRASTPVLPKRSRRLTASSKQSSEHPVRRDLGGVGAGPVAPESGWRCAEVETSPTGRVTSDRRRNTLGNPKTNVSDRGSVVP